MRSMFRLWVLIAAMVVAVACGEEEERRIEGCTTETSALVSRASTSEEEYQEQKGKAMYSDIVRRKYKDLLWSQPNVQEVSTGFFRDGKGGWTDTWGIIVWVTEKVDQSTLPPEDRIPDYLEGFPVQIIDEGPLPEAVESVCDYGMCTVNSIEKEEEMETTPESGDEFRARRHEVRLKYNSLFWRQPNVFGVSEGFLADGRGGWTEEVGINVKVTKKVDQSTLPPGDRIPDCLEGIPVRITEYGEDERPKITVTA